MKRIFPIGALMMTTAVFAHSEYSHAAPAAKPKVAAPKPAAKAKAAATISQIVKVVDENDKPLAGVTVAFTDFLTTAQSGTVPVFTVQKTDAQGQIVAQVPADKQTIFMAWLSGRVVGSGFHNASTREAKKDAPIILQLLPIEPLHIRLIDMKGKPVAGAKIAFVYRRNVAQPRFRFSSFATYAEKSPFPKAATESISDADGKVTLPFGAAGDNVAVRIEKAGLQTTAVQVAVGDDENLAVRLAPGATFRGRLITKGSKKPAANLALSLLALSWDRETLQGDVRTDAQGAFTFTGADDVPVYLQLDSETLVAPLEEVAPQRGKILELGDIEVSSGALVSGKVIGGKPEYVLAYVGDGRQFSWNKNVKVKPDGTYQMRLPAGTFFVQRGYENGIEPMPQTLTVKEGDKISLDLPLTPRGTTTIVPRNEDPQNRSAPDTISGTVKDAKSGAPIEGATVFLSGNGPAPLSAQSNARGQFVFGALPLNPNGQYQLRAEKSGLAALPVNVDPYSENEVALTMKTARLVSLSFRVVTTGGDPVEGATVKTQVVYLAARGPGGTEVPPDVPLEVAPGQNKSVGTDDAGRGKLGGLPEESFVEFLISKDGYADVISLVALPRRGVIDFVLPREAVVFGHARLADGRPVGSPSLAMRVVGGSYPYNQGRYWRDDRLKPDGAFEVRKIVPTTMMGIDVYGHTYIPGPGFGLAAGDVGGGFKAQTVPPGRGYDLMLIENRNGREQRWIRYLPYHPNDLVLQEGERRERDEIFQPMALIRGKAPAGGVAISYHDPQSDYGDWEIKADSDGNFELPVPLGDVELKFGGAAQIVKDLKAHEIRVVELKAETGAAASPAGNEMTMLNVRVVGPDGATVPRPQLAWRLAEGASTRNGMPGGSSSFGNMDGSAEFYLWQIKEGAKIEISSPQMDKPQIVTLGKDVAKKRVKVRFDRVPETVPQPQQERFSPVSSSGEEAEKPQNIARAGEMAPQLEHVKWQNGKAVTLAELRGKIVVIAFYNYSESTLAEIKRRFDGKPLALLLIKNQPTDEASPDSEKQLTAVGQDARIKGDWHSFNALRFGAENGGVLIGADGRIVGTGITGAFLVAKIDQMLATAQP